jgi:hypothetical protein
MRGHDYHAGRLVLTITVIAVLVQAASAQSYQYPSYRNYEYSEDRNPMQGGGYSSRGDIWWSAPPSRNYTPYPYYPNIRRQYQYQDYYNPGRPFLPGINYR